MYEILGSFTRDFDHLKSRLASLAEYDKSCVETALLGVKAVVAEEWGSGTACQVSSTRRTGATCRRLALHKSRL